MRTKLKEQLPALALTLVVVLGAGFGAAWWFHNKTITSLTAKQEEAISRLREQHADEIRAANDESSHRLEALNLAQRSRNQIFEVFFDHGSTRLADTDDTKSLCVIGA